MNPTVPTMGTLLSLLSPFLGCGSAPPAPPLQPPGKAPVEAPAAAAHDDACSGPISADGTTRTAAHRLLTTQALCESWFSQKLLEAVPPSKLEEIRDALGAELGRYREVVDEGGQLFALFEHGRLPMTLTLDTEKRVAGLWFKSPQISGVDLETILTKLDALPGKVSVLVLTDGEEVGSRSPDAPLAVGSAFKLAVLAALADKEKAKGASGWKSLVELTPSDASLPSGQLQNWPPGISLTTGSLAALMISNSDNTATDALIRYVGRAAVEQHGGPNRPFLSTRELFLVKDPAHPDRIDRYRSGDEKARRALLNELAGQPLPKGEAIASMVPSPDVEWFFSGRALCGLMDRVHALPAMHINPGLTDPESWDEVAFKGGSEPGVLNFTTRLARGGHHHCVAATWNHSQPLDEDRFMSIYRGLLGALPAGSSETPSLAP